MAERLVEQAFITVLVDSDTVRPGLKPAYGLSIHIEALSREKAYSILFDTGPSYDVLLNNANMMEIDLNSVDRIIISHFHKDHYGALDGLLSNTSVKGTLFVPEEPWFAKKVLDKARKVGWRVARVHSLSVVAPGIYAFGPVARSLEISLKINFENNSSALLIGCGHAGLPIILRWAGIKRRLALIAGGFHLKEEGKEKARAAAEYLALKNIEKVMPLHCSNHKFVFRSILGNRYIAGGAGSKISIP